MRGGERRLAPAREDQRTLQGVVPDVADDDRRDEARQEVLHDPKRREEVFASGVEPQARRRDEGVAPGLPRDGAVRDPVGEDAREHEARRGPRERAHEGRRHGTQVEELDARHHDAVVGDRRGDRREVVTHHCQKPRRGGPGPGASTTRAVFRAIPADSSWRPSRRGGRRPWPARAQRRRDAREALHRREVRHDGDEQERPQDGELAQRVRRRGLDATRVNAVRPSAVSR